MGHEGPVWQLAWAHPKFGSILASCGYDSRVYIYKEQNNIFKAIKDHFIHSSSGLDINSEFDSLGTARLWFDFGLREFGW